MFYPKSLSGKLFRYYLLMPSHPAKIRIQNFLGKFLFLGGIEIQNKDGLKFILSPNDWITRYILSKGSYEPASIELAENILKDGGIFIDIGANFGLYCCTVTYNKNVQSIAIDPNYKIISHLISNIKLNKLNNKIKIINAAVSSQFQLVSMEEPNPSNLGTTFLNMSGSGALSVLSCSLEYILQVNKLETIDLIKIDIEGNEFDTIEHFPFEKYNIKNIILEFKEDSKISFDNLKSFFLGKGFKTLNVTGQEIIDKDNIPEDNIWLSNISAMEYN